MRLALFLSGALILARSGHSEDLRLRIPPLKTSFEMGSQTIPVTAWGTVSNASPSVFRLDLTADLAGLQDDITPLLRTELNRSDRCGERLSIDHAVLGPSDPAAAALTVHLHYERWGCAKVFGKEAVKRLVGGDAVVAVALAPSARPEGIAIAADVKKIEADGSLGEVLRSGALGTSVKEKIANSIQNAVRKSLDLKAALPPRIGAAAAFDSARFSSSPEGRLWISGRATLRLSSEEVQALSRQMQSH
jgi:hypothetical protein